MKPFHLSAFRHARYSFPSFLAALDLGKGTAASRRLSARPLKENNHDATFRENWFQPPQVVKPIMHRQNNRKELAVPTSPNANPSVVETHSPEKLAYGGQASIPITSELRLDTVAPPGIWPAFRLLVSLQVNDTWSPQRTIRATVLQRCKQSSLIGRSLFNVS